MDKNKENDKEKNKEYFDGENYYTEKEFFNSEDEPSPNPKKRVKRVKTIISVLVIISLFSYVLAIYPQLFNRATIDFISISIELSKNKEVQLYKESVVIVKTETGKGTGFLFSNDGYIMTNYHVIGNQQTIKVTFNDGKTYPAKVINSDEQIDIAIIKIEEGLEYPVLELENSWDKDELIYIIGNPLYSSFIVNRGNVLGLMSNDVIPILVIDAPVYKGNSGSPVINSEGKVIGIVYATTNVYVDGVEKKVGLAIPIEYVELLR